MIFPINSHGLYMYIFLLKSSIINIFSSVYHHLQQQHQIVDHLNQHFKENNVLNPKGIAELQVTLTMIVIMEIDGN